MDDYISFCRKNALLILDLMNSDDIVKVVRCKDCRHRIYDETRERHYCGMYYGLGIVKDDNYCSYGERADNE